MAEDPDATVDEVATVDAGAEPALRPTALARQRRWTTFALLAVWGPGLIVMLADTDAGSIITAAQSGAQFGYALVLPEIVLIPILYLAQEMTVRLGVVTGKGHGALIRDHFGPRWASVSAGTLLLSAVGALLTEFAGIAGVGELFGVSKWVTVPVATLFLIAVAFTRSYRRVERVGIAVGLAELAFVGAMILADPSGHQLIHGLGSLPLGNSGYLTLLAANVGAVIMPWMVFYQQGAVIDKGLTPADLRAGRRDTAVGAVITQGVMIVVVVALAATFHQAHHGRGASSLTAVPQIANALTPDLGAGTARILVGVSLLGAALVAALVVSLAGAWGMAEVLGWKHSLNERLNRQNAKFYLTYCLAHIVGAALVLGSVDLVGLAVDVEVMNSLLLPIVLGFLLLLEARTLPPRYRMRGGYRLVVTVLCLLVMAFGLYMVPVTIGW